MLRIPIFALVLAVASANLQTDWNIYKKTHSKNYDADEDIARRGVYESNLRKIQDHNDLFAQGKSSYMMGINQFTDWTYEEFSRNMKGMKIETKPSKDTPDDGDVDVESLPKSVDWRKKGFVTPVKDQGKCGSCWAFSVVGTLEGAHFNATGKLVSLSESNLLDCAKSAGCTGGTMFWAYDYIISNKGIDTEKSYPYAPEKRPCRFKNSTVGATMKKYVKVKQYSEKALQVAVATVGPVSVAIDASDKFMHYKGGLFDDSTCQSLDYDHAMVVVGYGVTDGKDYWLVKNSFGTAWGEQGYIRMSRNKNNQCAIATVASYPVL